MVDQGIVATPMFIAAWVRFGTSLTALMPLSVQLPMIANVGITLSSLCGIVED